MRPPDPARDPSDSFPKVESSLSSGLLRISALQHEPHLETDEEQREPGAAHARADETPSGSRARYILRSELGRGGMGTVFEVVDSDLRRRLAMKVAHCRGPDERAAVEVDQEMLSRFLEEAQVTGQLDHPGIVPLHELGMDDRGRVYFTMRLVKGKSLTQVFDLVRRGEEGWTLDRALNALIKVCEAIAYAHSKGVVHRDLKPDNVMTGRFGEVYVMDWGLAKVRGRPEAAPASNASASQVRTMRDTESGSGLITQFGTIVGTPLYMSPEQARGDVANVDARSDVYSLGAILYHLIAGHAPYLSRDAKVSATTVLRWLLEGPPPPLRGIAPHAPPELIAICDKAMSREPVARYQDVRDLAEDLRRFLAGRPVSALPLGTAARAARWCRRNPTVVGFLAALILGSGFGLWRLARLGRELVQQSALESATMEAGILREVNSLYSAAVASRVDREHVQVTHDYAAHPGAVPLPATFLTELGQRVSRGTEGMSVRQYSDFPFRFRGPPRMDAFEAGALASLRARPDQPAMSFEDVDGRPTLRYAIARRMEAGCVACHNAHPESTKTDWKEGDVRGVLEIIRPLDQDEHRVANGVRGALLLVGAIVGGLSLVSALAVLWVVRRAAA